MNDPVFSMFIQNQVRCRENANKLHENSKTKTETAVQTAKRNEQAIKFLNELNNGSINSLVLDHHVDHKPKKKSNQNTKEHH